MATKKQTIKKSTAKKAAEKKPVPQLKPKYSGLIFAGKIWKNPLTAKDAKFLAEKHPLGEKLFVSL
jgi:hypothetical protein